MIGERTIEFEGKHYLVQKRETSSPAGVLIHYSFDQGASWWPTMVEGFQAGRDARSLLALDPEPDSGGSFEAFVLALIQEIQGLKVGEGLKIMRDLDQVVVAREHTVLATKASLLNDVQLDVRQEGA